MYFQVRTQEAPSSEIFKTQIAYVWVIRCAAPQLEPQSLVCQNPSYLSRPITRLNLFGLCSTGTTNGTKHPYIAKNIVNVENALIAHRVFFVTSTFRINKLSDKSAFATITNQYLDGIAVTFLFTFDDVDVFHFIPSVSEGDLGFQFRQKSKALSH
jgi:hypothetical protein